LGGDTDMTEQGGGLSGEEFDNMMDQLPKGARNRVLIVLGGPRKYVDTKKLTKGQKRRYVLLFSLSLLWDFVWTCAGLLFCLTIIGIPIGFGLFVLGALPVVSVIGHYRKVQTGHGLIKY
jgi:hypothetical protein